MDLYPHPDELIVIRRLSRDESRDKQCILGIDRHATSEYNIIPMDSPDNGPLVCHICSVTEPTMCMYNWRSATPHMETRRLKKPTKHRLTGRPTCTQCWQQVVYDRLIHTYPGHLCTPLAASGINARTVHEL